MMGPTDEPTTGFVLALIVLAMIVLSVARIVRLSRTHQADEWGDDTIAVPLAEPRADPPAVPYAEPRDDRYTDPPADLDADLDAEPTAAPQHATAAAIPGTTALASPPSFDAAMAIIRAHHPDRYVVPLGWRVGTHHAAAELMHVSLRNGVHHIAISGLTGSGKDGILRALALALIIQHGPDAVQFAIVDGSRGVNWGAWASHPSTWRYIQYNGASDADDEENQGPAVDLKTMFADLNTMFETRAQQLIAARCDSWDQLPDDARPPLIVVLLTELRLFVMLYGKSFEQKLTALLSDGRKFGVRVIIQNQTYTRMGTEWRSQTGMFIAGAQPSANHDAPNTGLTTTELLALGATPPSKLPESTTHPGTFTLVQGRNATTVRTPYLPHQEMLTHLDAISADAAAVARETTGNAGENAGENAGNDGKRFRPVSDNFPDAETSFPAAQRDLGKYSDTVSAFSRFPRGVFRHVWAGIRADLGKTEIVKNAPGYTSRQHAQFADYYERVKDLYDTTVPDEPPRADTI